jgi:hypothetical protein
MRYNQLFVSSLEMEKFQFVTALINCISDAKGSFNAEILSNSKLPYKEYHGKIHLEGDFGEAFMSKT